MMREKGKRERMTKTLHRMVKRPTRLSPIVLLAMMSRLACRSLLQPAPPIPPTCPTRVLLPWLDPLS